MMDEVNLALDCLCVKEITPRHVSTVENIIEKIEGESKYLRDHPLIKDYDVQTIARCDMFDCVASQLRFNLHLAIKVGDLTRRLDEMIEE